MFDLATFDRATSRFAHAIARTERGLPKGPPLPPVVQLLRWAHDPIGVLEHGARRYGDLFTLHSLGLPQEVMVSRPDHVREVFTAQATKLCAGEANAPFLGPILGPHSLLLLDGERHLAQRRLMLPPFHGDRMRAYADCMRDITHAVLARWAVGDEVKLHAEMQELTLDVIMRTVFGIEDAARFAELRGKLLALLSDITNPLWFVEALRVDLGPLTSFARLSRTLGEVDALLFDEIRRRRARGAQRRNDILSMLVDARDERGLAMSDVELRDELVTLLLAGHETTATLLGWALYHVLSRPALLARLCGELDDVVGDARLTDAHLPKLGYLDATLKETLRLTPVVPMVGRKLSEPMHILGYDMPAGAVLVPCAYLTHRRADVWPEPERFEPERFLDARIDPYAFYPFGGGTRRCIGAAFALFEAKIVLAEVLRHVELELVPGYVGHVESRGVTFAPRGGVPARVKARRAALAAPDGG